MKTIEEAILEFEDFRNFNGKSTFLFKKGLNLINAPNSSGKTSLINTLELFISDDLLQENLINKDAERAIISLDAGEIDKIVLEFDKETGELRKKQSVKKEINGNTHDLCFITENHYVMKAALDKDFMIIRDWLVSLTDFPYFQKAYEIIIKQINSYEIERNKQNSELYSRRKYLLSKITELKSQKKLQENIYQSIINEKVGTTDLKDLFANERKLSDQVIVLERDYQKLKNEIVSFESKLKEENKQLEYLENELNLLSKKEKSAPKEIESLEKEIQDFQNKISSLRNEIDTQSELFVNRNIIERNLEEIEELISEEKTECPKCHSQITMKHLRDEKNRLIKELDVLNSEIKQKMNQQEEFEKEKRKLEKLNTQIKTNVPKQKSEIEKEKSQSEANIRRIGKKIPELEEELKKSKILFDEKQKSYQELQNKTDKMRKEFEESNEKLTDSKARIDQINKQLEDFSKEITEIDVKTEELNKYDDYIKRLEIMSELISEKITFIQKEVIETLNNEIAKMTKSFDFNEIKRIYINDDFKITIQKTGNRKIDFSDLSMFERKTIGVIIAFVLKQKFAPDFPFFVIDEYLNSLDEEKDLVALDYLKESENIIILTKSTSENTENAKLTQDNVIYIK